MPEDLLLKFQVSVSFRDPIAHIPFRDFGKARSRVFCEGMPGGKSINNNRHGKTCQECIYCNCSSNTRVHRVPGFGKKGSKNRDKTCGLEGEKLENLGLLSLEQCVRALYNA